MRNWQFWLGILFCLGVSTPAQSNPFDDSLVFVRQMFDFNKEAHSVAKTIYLQEKLLTLANRYVGLKYVPYIWGGGIIGSKKNCLKCRRCVAKKKVGLKNRLRDCLPCRRCGLDCSHFIHKLYREVGLGYNYASTWELSRQTKKGLLRHYDMVDIGTNLSLAQTGDLLVYKRHMGMLARVISPSRGDIIHISRFRGDRLKLGGFRWDRNRNLLKLRGRLLKILRHRAFFENPNTFTRNVQTGTEYLATNP